LEKKVASFFRKVAKKVAKIFFPNTRQKKVAKKVAKILLIEKIIKFT
jgi:hypothetical protein